MSFLTRLVVVLFLLGGLNLYAAMPKDSFQSTFVNKSEDARAYILVKTRSWPKAGCIIDSGKDFLMPKESTRLVIANKKECSQAGIGYSLYKSEDLKREHLLGYVSHRFRDGKFSLQVSVFCRADECIFKGLNPQQE